MNKEKFRKIVKAKTGSVAMIPALMELCGLQKNAASNRICGRIPFRADEIERLRKAFDISNDDVVDIFIKGA